MEDALTEAGIFALFVNSEQSIERYWGGQYSLNADFIFFAGSIIGYQLYLNAATFIPSSKSFLLGLKNLGPLRLAPKNAHPPVQAHFPVGLFVSGQRNHNFLWRSSCTRRNFCCALYRFWSLMSGEEADSTIRGEKLTVPTLWGDECLRNFIRWNSHTKRSSYKTNVFKGKNMLCGTDIHAKNLKMLQIKLVNFHNYR